MRSRLRLHLPVQAVRAPHRYRLDDLFPAGRRSVLLREVHRIHAGLIRAVLMRDSNIRLRGVHARRTVHFLVDANAVLPNVALVPNLGGDAPLVQGAGRQASLALLDATDYLAAVDFALVAHLLLWRRS